jgi:hypothetical protein
MAGLGKPKVKTLNLLRVRLFREVYPMAYVALPRAA